MVIKGNGGEGKSQIGAVLSTIFGTNMKDGSIGKISENRFARADLEHILLCVDDDMRMEALRQTNYVTVSYTHLRIRNVPPMNLIFWGCHRTVGSVSLHIHPSNNSGSAKRS